MNNKKIKIFQITIISILSSIIIGFFLLKKIDIKKITFGNINFYYIIPIIIIYYFQVFSYSYRLCYIIKKKMEISFYNALLSFCYYKVFLLILPVCFAEGIKAYSLKKTQNITITSGLGNITIDRIIDALSYLIIGILSLILLPDLLSRLIKEISFFRFILIIAIIILFVLIAFLLFLFRKKYFHKIPFRNKITEYLKTFKNLQFTDYIPLIMLTIFNNFLVIVLIILLGHSININITIKTGIIVFCFQLFSLLIPSIANIGSIHAAIVFALYLFNYNYNSALYYAIIYFFIIYILQASLGIFIIFDRIKKYFFKNNDNL